MLRFFDADLGVGGTGFSYPSLQTPIAVLAMMDHYGIQDALVYDRPAHESGFFSNFDFILKFCRRNPRLHPAIPILPPACGEQPPPDELVDFILKHKIKAVRACPEAHNYLFDLFSMQKILAPLEKHRIPVIYVSQRLQDHPWAHQTAWRNLHEVAQAFPRLPIVVVYAGMLEGRRILPALEGCPNLLADLTCVSFQYIEYVTKTFGAHRLVLASHFPTEDPGLYTSWVTYCGVSSRHRQWIAHANLRRLLEGIQ